MGGTLGEEMVVHEGNNLSPRAAVEETTEERLARIRNSNIRRNFRQGQDEEAFQGLSRGEQVFIRTHTHTFIYIYIYIHIYINIYIHI